MFKLNAQEITRPQTRTLPRHLRRAPFIEIMREVVADFRKPVLLYPIGKDSSFMLHLAQKAFYRQRSRSRCCMSTRPGSFAR